MKYKEGQKLTLRKTNQPCTVVHVTPYHESDDPHAFVTVELKNGDLRQVPVKHQDEYLTTAPPVPLVRKWLTPEKVSR